MALNIKNGLVQINETSEDRIINFHLKRGFAMLTAFRSENSLSENRARNRRLANDLKMLGYSYAKVTGGYVEVIKEDNPNWDIADIVDGRDDIRRLPVMEESFLVTVYNIKTGELADFKVFKEDMIDLGIKYEQDSVLVSPPAGLGSPSYIVTNNKNGDIGSTDCSFSSLSVANVADTYFTMKEKTINKSRAKRREGVGGVKFESAWLDEPAHTISGVRMRDNRNEIAPFGSHYYNMSNLNTKYNKLESRVRKLERLLNKFNRAKIKSSLNEGYGGLGDLIWDDEADSDGKIEVVVRDFYDAGRSESSLTWELSLEDEDEYYYYAKGTVIDNDDFPLWEIGAELDIEIPKDSSITDIEDYVRDAMENA